MEKRKGIKIDINNISYKAFLLLIVDAINTFDWENVINKTFDEVKYSDITIHSDSHDVTFWFNFKINPIEIDTGETGEIYTIFRLKEYAITIDSYILECKDLINRKIQIPPEWEEFNNEFCTLLSKQIFSMLQDIEYYENKVLGLSKDSINATLFDSLQPLNNNFKIHILSSCNLGYIAGRIYGSIENRWNLLCKIFSEK